MFSGISKSLILNDNARLHAYMWRRLQVTCWIVTLWSSDKFRDWPGNKVLSRSIKMSPSGKIWFGKSLKIEIHPAPDLHNIHLELQYSHLEEIVCNQNRLQVLLHLNCSSNIVLISSINLNKWKCCVSPMKEFLLRLSKLLEEGRKMV